MAQERRVNMTEFAQRITHTENLVIDLDKKVTLMDDRQIKNIADVDGLKKEINELDESIHGNGKPGLCQEVALLTVAVNHLNDFMKDIKAIGKWLLFAIIGTGITLVINLLLSHGQDLV